MGLSLKQLILQARDKPIVKNFVALSFLQLTNYLLPLATVPYVIRVVGLEKFGLVSFVQAFMVFFSVVTDYGFNLTSTREISIHRNDPAKVRQIYHATLSTKIFLCFAMFVMTLILVLLIPKLNADPAVFIGAFLLVISQAIFPVWFFQGVEKMQFLTYLNVLSKAIAFIMIFVFIKHESDYVFIIPIYAFGGLLAAIAALYIVRSTFNVDFSFVSYSVIKQQLREGFSIFASNISVTIYNSATILILGIFVTDLVIGYYSAAEKVMMLVRQILGVFSQAIYPHICNLALSGISMIRKFWKKAFVPFLFGILTLCVLSFLFADTIVLFLTSEHISEVSVLIKILAFVPFIVATNIPSYQTLLAYNLRKQCFLVLGSASVLNIILNGILSYYFQALGTAVALVITEVYISAGLFIILTRSTDKIYNTGNANGNL